MVLSNNNPGIDQLDCICNEKNIAESKKKFYNITTTLVNIIYMVIY